MSLHEGDEDEADEDQSVGVAEAWWRVVARLQLVFDEQAGDEAEPGAGP